MSPHNHNIDIPYFTAKEIIALDRLDGGEIRGFIQRGDNFQEPVALVNLAAIISRFASDVDGNKFGAFFVVPESFWEWIILDAFSRWGRQIESFPRNKGGGYEALVSNSTIYVDDSLDTVLCRTDHNGVCWEFRITSTHNLTRRPIAFQLLGPNMGFDDVIVFHPMLGVPPRPLLEEWAGQGIRKAQDMIVKLNSGFVPFQLPEGSWVLLHENDIKGLESGTTKIQIEAPKDSNETWGESVEYEEGVWAPIS